MNEHIIFCQSWQTLFCSLRIVVRKQKKLNCQKLKIRNGKQKKSFAQSKLIFFRIADVVVDCWCININQSVIQSRSILLLLMLLSLLLVVVVVVRTFFARIIRKVMI
jgi:hypothetical protein